MTIDLPRKDQLPALRRLWKQAFGDPDSFLDVFFSAAFDPRRCRCLTEDGHVAAALYWFDCFCRGKKLAYIYAVATESACRGRGLCRTLMDKTHADLAREGYGGTVLVPGEPGLFAMYGRMGYSTCAGIRELRCEAAEDAAALTPITPEEYAHLRRALLPEGGVVQEGVSLDFLAKQGQFYAGDGVVLFAVRDGETLFVPELLGDASAAPGIVTALGAEQGIFRTPGNDRDFAMYRPLSDAPAPAYFGFAFD